MDWPRENSPGKDDAVPDGAGAAWAMCKSSLYADRVALASILIHVMTGMYVYASACPL